MSVVEFPGRSRRYRPYRRRALSMHVARFRSYAAIMESSEPELIHDVGLDVGKAKTKLQKLRRHAAAVQERAAAELDMLETAETKLFGAIVAALLAGRGKG